MRRVSGWVVISLCLAVFVGCGDDDDRVVTDAGMGDAGDGGRVDGGDGGVCAGRSLCTTASTSCDADTLVVCAADADGCLVETRTGCGTTSTVCDATSGTAACVDPCTLLPAASRCTTDGERTCTAATLSVCAPDADGCLVVTATDCAAAPGGICDTTGAMPMCAAPADACAGIPAAERCTTAGTSCTDANLITCAPNAFGCLVTTTTDCTSRAGGACDATGTAAICTSTTPCATPAACTAGVSCDGPALVTCAPDAFGCLAETRADCSAAAFGFCDATATPAAICSTAATDPCLGMTACGTAPTRTCTDRGTLTICAPNAFGCYLSTNTDCTTGGEVCDATDPVAICVDPCSLIDTCAGATDCDGNALLTCTADADGCFVESSRATCDIACVTAAGVSACADPYCPEAQPAVIDCASGTITGTTVGGTTARDGYCFGGTSYAGAERIYRFRNSGTARQAVRIVSTRTAATGDFDLFVWDGGDGTNICTASTISCLDSSVGSAATETVDFVGEPGQTEYVAYDIYSVAATTSAFTLAVTCTPIVCGDGMLTGDEACDDGNTTAGDGCSATCAVEMNYGCTGTPSVCAVLCGNGVVNSGNAETCDDGNIAPGDGCSATCTVETGFGCGGTPSVCLMSAANSVCSAATPVAATTTITGQRSQTGGARPTATACGGGTGRVLYYAVTIPANTRVAVQTTPGTFDITLTAQDACASTMCTFQTDTSPERASLVNSTAAPVTRIVAVGGYGANTAGTWDIAFTYASIVCGDGAPEGAEICDDGNVVAGDGCSATCTLESGYLCSGTPSVCRVVAANGFCSGATPVTATTTLSGESVAAGGLPLTGTGCYSFTVPTTNRASYYAVTVPPLTRINIAVTPTVDVDVVLVAADSCAATTCSLYNDSDPERGTLTNTTATAITQIVSVRAFGATTSSGTYSIAFTYVPFVCGNGVLEGAETCDDGNTTAGDGCTATCTVQAGYACSGAPSVCALIVCGDGLVRGTEGCDDSNTTAGDGCSATCTQETGFACVGSPSVCVAAAGNAFCASAEPITGTDTLSGESTAGGGARPTATGCGGGPGLRTLYYAVTIPAATQVVVQTTPLAGADLILFTQDACGATTCPFSTDSEPERATLTNSGTTAVTRIVGVRGYLLGTVTYNIAFTYTAL